MANSTLRDSANCKTTSDDDDLFTDEAHYKCRRRYWIAAVRGSELRFMLGYSPAYTFLPNHRILGRKPLACLLL